MSAATCPTVWTGWRAWRCWKAEGKPEYGLRPGGGDASQMAVSGANLLYGRPYARDQGVVFRLRFFRGCPGKRGGPPPSFGFGERQADVLPDKTRDLRC